MSERVLFKVYKIGSEGKSGLPQEVYDVLAQYKDDMFLLAHRGTNEMIEVDGHTLTKEYKRV